jgi:hypothetical protein
MSALLAACGLRCDQCEAYLATQTNDQDRARRVAEKWGKEFRDGKPFPVEATICDGCLTESPRKGGYCGQCAVRACAVERKLPTCAHCDDYGCEKLEQFLTMAGPQLRNSLNELRRSFRA